MPTKLADGLGLRDVLFKGLIKTQDRLEIRPRIWFLRSNRNWIRLIYSSLKLESNIDFWTQPIDIINTYY